MLTQFPDQGSASDTGARATGQRTAAAPDPPVDLSSLQPLFEGNPAFQKRLIETFLTHSQSTIAAMQRALSTADSAALRQAAHSLKGAAGEMGAEPLRRAAAALELEARHGRAEATAASLVQAVASELARVAEILRATLP